MLSAHRYKKFKIIEDVRMVLNSRNVPEEVQPTFREVNGMHIILKT